MRKLGIRLWICCTSPESIYLRSTVPRALSLRSERQRTDLSVIFIPFLGLSVLANLFNWLRGNVHMPGCV
ncbi:uncharacterized protein BDW47DRAFT_100585 [Aspergillus candidus]|uniref:Uncharacterized protein n=1 Tax=Aspergillus candidus TaxID=41067 RepID=A0A2I2FJ33_ASPCN|nr:hypothetical protein BDW47DRAFT_100585 [Aspergillus candidus]PLB40647.1 hypothetical protein BDW47DRAFT_100585 [Aspergillus candidus]